MLKKVVRSSSNRATAIRFACVGTSIAFIDAGLLYLLKDAPGFNIYLARLVSYTAAMSVGYFLNRYFTFHHLDRVRVLWDELLRFFSVHAVGGLINFAVFALIVMLGERLGLAGVWKTVWPLLGVWIGGLFGLTFNFLLSRKIVFGD
ncbi:MAG: GtrA family protein [Xanthomonadaceae bacterium]|nr:GtrA family protein [Xanthomonadaceae bacterium]